MFEDCGCGSCGCWAAIRGRKCGSRGWAWPASWAQWSCWRPRRCWCPAGPAHRAKTVAAAGDKAAEKPPAGDSRYDHFLYVRHNEVNGSAKTDSLVLAKVTPEGFQQRDVFTKNNLHIGWYPLDVINGWAYGVKLGELIAINLESGATEKLGTVGNFTYDSGRLYTLRDSPGRLIAHGAPRVRSPQPVVPGPWA